MKTITCIFEANLFLVKRLAELAWMPLEVRKLLVQKSPRIQDVARAAGVSTATVSRALSNPDLLTKATRDAVQEAIRITGYRVNRAARNLRRRQAGAVLVLVPNLGNPFFSQILSGISAGFADSDRSILIADTADLLRNNKRLVDYFLDARIDGMISLDGGLGQAELDQLNQHRLSDRVVFACEWVHGAAMPSVRSDNAGGASAAIRHLHGLGHRDIAHVTGPAGNVLTRARRDAVLAERQALDLPVRDEWIIRGDFSLESGHQAAQQILQMTERPSAVFCASDMVAFGLIAGLTAAGVRVPEDISVVGFDDIEQSEYFVPALTTIRQDRRRLGQGGAALLLEQLRRLDQDGRADGDQLGTEPPVETIGVELVVRASTAPAKDQA